MFISIKITKLFINLIRELIILVSCKKLCSKTDEYAARSFHKQEIVKIRKTIIGHQDPFLLQDRHRHFLFVYLLILLNCHI